MRPAGKLRHRTMSRVYMWALMALVASLGFNDPLAAAPPPLRIDDLNHDARRPLRVGDTLTVTLRASAGGIATFSIQGVAAEIRMREARSGVYGAAPAVYTGTYEVERGDAVHNGAVFAVLRIGTQELVAASDRPVVIDTRPPVVR